MTTVAERVGRFFSPVSTFLGYGRDSPKLILLGLDAAGKTTFLYKIKGSFQEVITTIPTIGFNCESLELTNFKLTCWDVGGCDKIRPLWRHYTTGSSMLVFVIDSNDKDRFPEASSELKLFLKDETMLGLPMLVLANKQDLPNACSVMEVVEKFELNKIRDRDWYIQGTCAPTGDGIPECIDWIESTLRKKKKVHKKEISPNSSALATKELSNYSSAELPPLDSQTGNTSNLSGNLKGEKSQMAGTRDGEIVGDATEDAKKDATEVYLHNITDAPAPESVSAVMERVAADFKPASETESESKTNSDSTPAFTATVPPVPSTTDQHTASPPLSPPSADISAINVVLNPQSADEIAAEIAQKKKLQDVIVRQDTLAGWVERARKEINLFSVSSDVSSPPDSTASANLTSVINDEVTITTTSDSISLKQHESDDQFISQVLDYSLDSWDHYTHIRLGWIDITRNLQNSEPYKIAFDSVAGMIRDFIAHSSRTNGKSYHCTMTHFWCHMIAHQMELFAAHRVQTSLAETNSSSSAFEQFLMSLYEPYAVELWSTALFKAYFSNAVLFGAEARAAVVQPDLAPLPELKTIE